MLILSNVDTKEEDLANMVKEVAIENKVSESEVIEAVKRWLEEHSNI